MSTNMEPQGNIQSASHPTRPARRWLEHTPADVVIALSPRGVMTNDGGTVTMEDVDGTVIVVTMTAWTIIPFAPNKITASTATTVYLIY